VASEWERLEFESDIRVLPDPRRCAGRLDHHLRQAAAARNRDRGEGGAEADRVKPLKRVVKQMPVVRGHVHVPRLLGTTAADREDESRRSADDEAASSDSDATEHHSVIRQYDDRTQ